MLRGHWERDHGWPLIKRQISSWVISLMHWFIDFYQTCFSVCSYMAGQHLNSQFCILPKFKLHILHHLQRIERPSKVFNVCKSAWIGRPSKVSHASKSAQIAQCMIHDENVSQNHNLTLKFVISNDLLWVNIQLRLAPHE